VPQPVATNATAKVEEDKPLKWEAEQRAGRSWQGMGLSFVHPGDNVRFSRKGERQGIVKFEPSDASWVIAIERRRCDFALDPDCASVDRQLELLAVEIDPPAAKAGARPAYDRGTLRCTTLEFKPRPNRPAPETVLCVPKQPLTRPDYELVVLMASSSSGPLPGHVEGALSGIQIAGRFEVDASASGTTARTPKTTGAKPALKWEQIRSNEDRRHREARGTFRGLGRSFEYDWNGFPSLMLNRSATRATGPRSGIVQLDETGGRAGADENHWIARFPCAASCMDDDVQRELMTLGKDGPTPGKRRDTATVRTDTGYDFEC
jgi:hypothetical protein